MDYFSDCNNYADDAEDSDRIGFRRLEGFDFQNLRRFSIGEKLTMPSKTPRREGVGGVHVPLQLRFFSTQKVLNSELLVLIKSCWCGSHCHYFADTLIWNPYNFMHLM